MNTFTESKEKIKTIVVNSTEKPVSDEKGERVNEKVFKRPEWQKRSGIQDIFVRYGEYFS